MHLNIMNRIGISAVQRCSLDPFLHRPRYLSCAALIIGDEILSGKTLEGNSHILAKKCFESGIELKRIVVVPDQELDIILEVWELAKNADIVITSGGIGPTHDDITYASMAKAFGLRLQYHDDTLERMRRAIHSKMNPKEQEKPIELSVERKRMALLPHADFPESDQVRVMYPDTRYWVPIVSIKTQWNSQVSIFPGIPSLYRDLLDGYFNQMILPRLPSSHLGYVRYMVGTSLPESDIATALSVIQKQVASEGIKIGSYPSSKALSNSLVKNRVIVSVTGKNEEEVSRCAEKIAAAIEGRVLDRDD